MDEDKPNRFEVKIGKPWVIHAVYEEKEQPLIKKVAKAALVGTVSIVVGRSIWVFVEPYVLEFVAIINGTFFSSW
jgi:hypothetical protein